MAKATSKSSRPSRPRVRQTPPRSGKSRKEPTILKYEGRAGFFEGALTETLDCKIERAVMDGNSVSFDWIIDDEVESVRLTTLDGVNYRGRSVFSPGTRHENSSEVEGVLYANATGKFLVCQCVTSDGFEDSWFVQFVNERSISVSGL